MKISISSSDEDDERIVKYVFRAENNDFKGTIGFYGYADIFKQFAYDILEFPFKMADPVEFNADGLSVIISLIDPVGRINLNVSIKDDENNFIEFNDTDIETEALQRFSSDLSNVDFSKEISIEWMS